VFHCSFLSIFSLLLWALAGYLTRIDLSESVPRNLLVDLVPAARTDIYLWQLEHKEVPENNSSRRTKMAKVCSRLGTNKPRAVGIEESVWRISWIEMENSMHFCVLSWGNKYKLKQCCYNVAPGWEETACWAHNKICVQIFDWNLIGPILCFVSIVCK